MKTIKVSDLEAGPQMDALVAKAQGWGKQDGSKWFNEPQNQLIWVDSKKTFKCSVDGYRPSTNGGQAMELVKEFTMVFGCNDETKPITYRAQCLYGYCVEPTDSQTPELAICRAVIASRFGEYVEID